MPNILKLEIHQYLLGQATDLKLILIAVVSFSFSGFTILQYTTEMIYV